MFIIPKIPVRKKYRSIAVLTSGGDAPGMNAAIRAVVRTGISHGCEVHGIIRGYSGLLEGAIEPLSLSSVANTIQRGGTILKTSRCPEFMKKTTRREAAELLRRRSIDALVVIGGDGSYAGAHAMETETGFPVIGVPGTIDNDIYGTDETIGFDTAVNVGLDAIDRIRDTASSHDRIFLVEVMGRHAGFIALQVGIAGGAETILIPERATSISEVCKTIDRGIQRGKNSSIIVVAEGARTGSADYVAAALSKHGHSAKVCILGHTQRGGSPTAHDRFLASTLGSAAVHYLLGGRSNAAVGVRRGEIVLSPFRHLVKKKKELPLAPIRMAQILAR